MGEPQAENTFTDEQLIDYEMVRISDPELDDAITQALEKDPTLVQRLETLKNSDRVEAERKKLAELEEASAAVPESTVLDYIFGLLQTEEVDEVKKLYEANKEFSERVDTTREYVHQNQLTMMSYLQNKDAYIQKVHADMLTKFRYLGNTG